MGLRWNLRRFAWSRECIPATSSLVIGRRPGVFVTLEERGKTLPVSAIRTHNYNLLIYNISVRPMSDSNRFSPLGGSTN